MPNAKNAYLARQNAVYDEMLNTGRRHGEQYAMDMVEIVLHREFGWGYQRIRQLVDKVSAAADYYAPAMQKDNAEQPIFQERMDNALLEFIGDNQVFYPFKERYPLIMEARYDKPLKKK